MIRAAAFALICSLASQAFAGEFRLHSPVACALGEDARCFIQNYVDRDPSTARRDFMCRAALTYDGHGGTDFALRSVADMTAGVAVRAAAAGTVRAVRDGLADIAYDPARDAARLEGRDCGNGVVIDHEDGWQTQYCHLRKGSVAVEPGAEVLAGGALGLIGMSGHAQFPHLHLHVRKDGVAVDPFAPLSNAACGETDAALFLDIPAYQPGGLISAGFAAALPEFSDIKAGTAHAASLPVTAPALVLWGSAFGTEPGDSVRLTITGLDGTPVFQTEAPQDRMQAQMFRAGGRRTAGADWFKPGIYRGDVALLRAGSVISDMQTTVTITSR